MKDKIFTIVFGGLNKGTIAIIPYREMFTYEGYSFVVHRPVINPHGETSNRYWEVSHYETGLKITMPSKISKTVAEAKEEAIRIIRDRGIDKLSEAVKQYEVVNINKEI